MYDNGPVRPAEVVVPPGDGARPADLRVEPWSSPSFRGVRSGRMLALLVLVLGLIVSGGTALNVRSSEDRAADIASEERAALVAGSVDVEMRRYVDTVRNVAASTGTHDELTAEKFAQTAAPLREMRLAGASAITFLVPATDEQIPAVQELWQARSTDDLELRPVATSSDHVFAVLRESLDGGTAARRGTDLTADPVPLAALTEARRTGQVTVSDAYNLLIDRNLPVERQQKSFILTAPVYGATDATGTRPFRGWVLMGLRGQDFIGGTLAQFGDAGDVRLSARHDDGALVPVAAGRSALVGARSATRVASVDVAQSTWQLDVDVVEATLPGQTALPAAIAGGGALLSLLLAALVFTLATASARARAQVDDATDELRRAEGEARAQAELLEAILNSISDGVGVVDENGEFLLHNEAAKVLLGIDQDQGGPENWQGHYGMFRGDGVEPFPVEAMPLVRALAGEATDQVEMIIRNAQRPGGVVLSVSGRPLRKGDGKTGAVAVFHDVTAQRRDEHALRQDRDHIETVAAVAASIAASAIDIDEIARTITAELATRVGDQAGFLRFAAATGQLHLLSSAGRDSGFTEASRQMLREYPPHVDDIDTGSIGEAARTKRTTNVAIEDPFGRAASTPEPFRSLVARYPIHHALHVPVLHGNTLLGVVTVVRVRTKAFDRFDVDLVEEVATRAGWAMAHAELFEAKDNAEFALRRNEALLRQTNEELQQSVDVAVREQDFSTKLLGAMHEGYLFTVDGHIEDVNDQFCALTGFSREELIGRARPYPFDSAMGPAFPADVVAGIDAVAGSDGSDGAEGSDELEIDLVHCDGDRIPVSVIVRAVHNADGTVNGHISTFSDLTVFRQREDALIAVAGRDPLTGLFNRRKIDEQYDRLRAGDDVIVLDLDHFKVVNDTLGHAAGDEALVSLARCIEGALRAKDWAGRLGGEEFIIVVRDGNHGGAASVMRRLRAAWAATDPPTTFSAGIATHAIGNAPRQTLAWADEAMYLAKRNGRDRIETAQPNGAHDPVTSLGPAAPRLS